MIYQNPDRSSGQWPQQPGQWPQQPQDAVPGPPSGQWPTPSFSSYPASYPPAAATLVTIGDIACTQTSVITPSGTAPLAGTVWSFTDMSRTTKTIPTWAIVLAVVLIVFCFISLLLLLVKEERTEGGVQVVVQGPGFLHQTMLPVSSIAQVQDYAARVGYARSLAAAATS
jgi:hypothetical protein